MISPGFDLGRYQALIFDMDGTLLDSSHALRAVFSAWCAQHHLDVDRVLTLCHGSPVRNFLGQLLPHAHPLEEERLLTAAEAQERTGIVALPGARALLDGLDAAGLPWGIATSSVEAVARLRLHEAGLPVPEVLVTAEQVKDGKPDPEPFVLAAARLGVVPAQCLAFEDSRNGVQSALAAGCDLVVMSDDRAWTQALHAQHRRIQATLRNYLSLLDRLPAPARP